jgi:hypothetical protein
MFLQQACAQVLQAARACSTCAQACTQAGAAQKNPLTILKLKFKWVLWANL